jgi:hypothetical protein
VKKLSASVFIVLGIERDDNDVFRGLRVFALAWKQGSEKNLLESFGSFTKISYGKINLGEREGVGCLL